MTNSKPIHPANIRYTPPPPRDDIYEVDPIDQIIEIERLTKQIKTNAAHMSKQEARLVFDLYNDTQRLRIKMGNRLSKVMNIGAERLVLDWFIKQIHVLERQLALGLDHYSKNHEVGRWIRSQVGVGPVIAAGLLAYIDIDKAPYANSIWRYAGLDPSVIWKGQDYWSKALGEVFEGGEISSKKDTDWIGPLLLAIEEVDSSGSDLPSVLESIFGHARSNTHAIELSIIDLPPPEDDEMAITHTMVTDSILEGGDWMGEAHQIAQSDHGGPVLRLIYDAVGNIPTDPDPTSIIGNDIPVIEEGLGYKLPRAIGEFIINSGPAGVTKQELSRRMSMRPWNPTLKVLAYKLGMSFAKVQNKEGAQYGRLLKERKVIEWDRNVSGEMIEEANRVVASGVKHTSPAYVWGSGQVTKEEAEVARWKFSEGEYAYVPNLVGVGEGQPMIPPGRINMRAQRWAVKMFLSHLHHVMYEVANGEPPARPYAIDVLGHRDYIAPYGWPMVSVGVSDDDN